MKQFYQYTRYGLMAIFLLTALLSACSKMDDTYKDFWKDGEIVYPEGADSLRVHSGKERILLEWLVLSDPTLTRAMIYWNNRSDSQEVPIQQKGPGVDTVRVMFPDMPEGTYSFDIITYDDKGNESVPVSGVGHSYGEVYVSTLLPRLTKTSYFADDSLKIAWSDPADITSLGSELIYTDTTGAERQIHVLPDVDSTIILDYDFDASTNYRYHTLFLPDSLSLDTFYTPYTSVKVLGPPIELPKTGWTVTASSYDQRSGDGRKPERAIDNDPATNWINQISPQLDYPHDITVDMGEVKENIFGFTLTVSNRVETPKDIEVLISEDGSAWTSMGRFTVKKEASQQFFDFPEMQQLRYFKMIAYEPSGDTKNIVVGEVGVYSR
ncbi:DUF4998 domain-containing protein [Compostibacter hankyongensis]|uniref:F5/8 type C domain-containing protein n=1 Tax=Compostibacter hankyongensis TaxID=1007089 RepID=A0ABP8FIT1_9BACT